jgi:hypothetical protein
VSDHPALEGEGKVGFSAGEDSPGWGGGGAADGGDAVYAEAPSPPPGPLARADLPSPGGGEDRPAVTDDRPSTRHVVTEGSPFGSGFIHQPRVSSSRPRDNSTVPSSASGPPSTTAQ